MARYTITSEPYFLGGEVRCASAAGFVVGETVTLGCEIPDCDGDVWATRDNGNEGFIAFDCLTPADRVEVVEEVSAADVKTGDRLRVVFEGTVDRDGDLRVKGEGWDMAEYVNRDVMDAATSIVRLSPPAPTWQAGDVVVTDYGSTTLYRTDAGHWLDASGAVFLDADVSDRVRSGDARHALRNGKAVTDA